MALIAEAGSSPHTRGLHGSADIAHSVLVDHPRTRGVYTTIPGTISTSAGSSPHTRGLRGSSHPRLVKTGIIPAHAGFTSELLGTLTVYRDHPRTRGVYYLGDGVECPAAGSSPHTRGLRSVKWGASHLRRIIPAHAGFTTRKLPSILTRWDHPRTRGVYRNSIWSNPLAVGSSPHTRGLRECLIPNP